MVLFFSISDIIIILQLEISSTTNFITFIPKSNLFNFDFALPIIKIESEDKSEDKSSSEKKNESSSSSSDEKNSHSGSSANGGATSGGNSNGGSNGSSAANGSSSADAGQMPKTGPVDATIAILGMAATAYLLSLNAAWVKEKVRK